MVTSLRQSLTFLLVVSIALVTAVTGFADQTDPSSAPAPIQSAPSTPEQLQQLVAPIALYPDELVAQILAASTYPTEVVEADRWMQAHADLKGKNIGISAPGMLSATGTRGSFTMPHSIASMSEKSLIVQGKSVPSA